MVLPFEDAVYIQLKPGEILIDPFVTTGVTIKKKLKLGNVVFQNFPPIAFDLNNNHLYASFDWLFSLALI